MTVMMMMTTRTKKKKKRKKRKTRKPEKKFAWSWEKSGTPKFVEWRQRAAVPWEPWTAVVPWLKCVP